MALLESRVFAYKEQILAAPNPLQAATEATYTAILEQICRCVTAATTQVRCERVALIGASIIDTRPQHEDYIDLRRRAVLRLLICSPATTSSNDAARVS